MGTERCDTSLLLRHLDGELSTRERRRLEAHLEACPDCRQALDGLRLVSGLLREKLEQPAQAADFSGFEDRVLAAVASSARPPLGERLRVAWGEWQRAWRPVWVTAVVTAAVALLVLVPLLTRGPDVPSAPIGPPDGDRPQTALGDRVDNQVIIDELEYRGQRSMIFSVSKNNTTVIWMYDFDNQAGAKDQGDDL
ncbi:MAG TPA: zf-HC2 domain-containing protein [Myxococcota bacterium]|nr:zf-HC2 domain-containing protein [Myxococcota bacterium]HRY94614.1 zf-HC2 domain-containing protein [Myxococcota bacterium]HSA20230.1 zf-HC2 domain-containing protein [Myxococcota bacterium]